MPNQLKKRGRPRIYAEGPRRNVTAQIDLDLYIALAAAAENSGISISREIEKRLSASAIAVNLRQIVREELARGRQEKKLPADWLALVKEGLLELEQVKSLAEANGSMEIRMSAASDALMKGLADLSAKLSTSVEDIKSKIAEAEAAQAAKDDATFAQANEQVKAMLDSLAPHAEAIGQMASAVAGGAGISAPVSAPAADVAPASAETAVQAAPAPAAPIGPSEPFTSTEAAAAAPASSSNSPASTEATADVAEPSAEDTAAKRKR